jgi:hypothetical protein
MLNLFWIWAGNMKVHWLIAFATCAMLHEPGATTLDLYTAAGFLLDMLDVSASMTNYLCTEIESRKGLKLDRDLLFWPLTLE